MNEFLKKANKLKPIIHTEIVAAKRIGKSCGFKKGDCAVFDFGRHYVGYPSVSFDYETAMDSPVVAEMFFAERETELKEDYSLYSGWISDGWIQTERIVIDEFPKKISLKRRFAFRYVLIKIKSAPSVGEVIIKDVSARCVTSAPEKIALAGENDKEKLIDDVAVRTLSECMQDVFEDGPKRDRRLWLGDLYLQAAANYKTFKKNDLVKRCLYLFAGTAMKDGRLCQSVFTGRKVRGDGQTNFDYPLLFIPALLDYYKETGDSATAIDLIETAERQISSARMFFDGNIVRDSEIGWCFLDWSFELDRQAGAQAVYVFAERALTDLLKLLNKEYLSYEKDAAEKSAAAYEKFFDKENGVVVSGEDLQVSYASNVWFVLAGILNRNESKTALKRIEKTSGVVAPVTPYLAHFYVLALCKCGETKKARKFVNDYWGEMVKHGDTFPEFFKAEDPDFSPYGGVAVHSYCHAWSCTPCLFFREHFVEKRQWVKKNDCKRI